MKFDGVTVARAGKWLKACEPSLEGVEVLDALADPERNAVYVKWVSRKREAKYDRAASSEDPDAVEKIYRSEEKEEFSVVFVNDSEDGGRSFAAEKMDAGDVREVLKRIGKRKTARTAPDAVAVVR